MKRSLWPACLALAACLLLCGCQKPAQSAPAVVGGSTRRSAVESGEVQFVWPGDDAVFATLETGKGNIRLVLYPQYAPLAVENFCALAAYGYYDNTTFHRIVRDFVIQGGDATGTGKSGHTVWGTTYQSEFTGKLHHYSGAVCAAAANGQTDTQQSQFYILTTPQDNLSETDLSSLTAAGYSDGVVEAYRQAGGAPYLDYTDTVFGQVVAGMDVVDSIARGALNEDGDPRDPVVVSRVVISGYSPVNVLPQPGLATSEPAADSAVS